MERFLQMLILCGLALFCSGVVLAQEDPVKDKVRGWLNLFNRIDANENQEIQEKEWEDFFEKYFEERDKDKNGKLGLDEVGVSEDVLHAHDQDQDLAFDEKEEIAFRMTHFETMDSDQDGKLQLYEYLEFEITRYLKKMEKARAAEVSSSEG